MHIYIDKSTQLPVLNKYGQPILRPIANNRSSSERWPSRWVSDLDRLRRAWWHFNYSFKEVFIKNREQVVAEERLSDGTYSDSDFKHSAYVRALQVARGNSQEQINKIALIFGLPSEALVSAYLRANPDLKSQFLVVLNDEQMTSELQKHTVKRVRFNTLLQQPSESVVQEDSKEDAERKSKYDADHSSAQSNDDPREPLLFVSQRAPTLKDEPSTQNINKVSDGFMARCRRKLKSA